MSLLFTLLAFFAALGILVAVHEWGHYRMAVACGVKVLTFSVGFGPTLLRYRPQRQRPGQNTEFVLSALPLGGYVRMLDKRDSSQSISAADMAHEFTSQPPGKRFLIVAAGQLIHQGRSQDPATHRAIETVFEQRLRVVWCEGRWLALAQ